METPSPLTSASWRISALRLLKFALVSTLIAAFVWSAAHELRSIQWKEVRIAFAAIDRHRFAFAALCLVANYALLTLYDWLAFRVLGVKLAWSAVAPRAAAAFAFSNFVGLGFVSGAAVRLRLYRDLVPAPATLAKVIALNGISLWGGLFATVGIALFLCAEPMMIPGKLTDVRNFAPVLVGLPAAWVLFTATGGLLPDRIRDILPPLKPLHILGLLMLAALDWVTLAAIYLALLGPIPEKHLIAGATGFWLSYLFAMISVIPAGIGIFEAAITHFLGPIRPAEEVLASALAYRILYYLFPWLLATLGMGIVAAVPAVGRLTPGLSERLRRFEPTMQEIVTETLAVLAFVCGAVLWISAALPAFGGRLEIAQWAFPLPGYLVATSHFLTVVAGALLILASFGLQQRHRESWLLVMGTLLAGALFTFLKGLDFEESILLVVVAALFWWARDRYDRAGHALSPRLARTAWGAVLACCLAYGVIGLWIHRDKGYDPELWTSLAMNKDQARFLRSLIPVAGMLGWLAFSFRWKGTTPAVPLPMRSDLEAAERIAREHARSTLALLEGLGDKAIWFSRGREAFLAWQQRGRTLLALGEPVGPGPAQRELIREFRRYADEWDLIPAFYQVPQERLPDYHALGFSFFQLGEEGFVDLAAFKDPGPDASFAREARANAAGEPADELEPGPGFAFEVMPPLAKRSDEAARSLLHEMRVISESWLAGQKGEEKRFSVAFFEESWIRSFPIALVRRAGTERTLLGYGVVLGTADKKELAADLVRWRPEEGDDVQEELFARLVAWGKAGGYASFSLGLSPLRASGAEAFARLEKASRVLFLFGERFYNFRRLRRFEERFTPRWEPRFLAVPGEHQVARALLDAALLISKKSPDEPDPDVD